MGFFRFHCADGFDKGSYRDTTDCIEGRMSLRTIQDLVKDRWGSGSRDTQPLAISDDRGGFLRVRIGTELVGVNS